MLHLKNKHVKTFLNIALLLTLFGLTLFSSFKGEDLRETLWFIQTAEPRYIVMSLLCVLGFILGESVVIAYLLDSLGNRANFGHCCLYSFIGFFYSCITPSASGGQPMQVVAMRKDNIPIAISTVVLAIVTITYKLVLVVIGLMVVLFRPANILHYLGGTEPLIHLGLFLNVGCIALLFSLVFSPNLIRSLAAKTLTITQKLRITKHPERLAGRIDRMVLQYTGTAEYYRTHKFVIVIVFLITLVQRVLLFLITWLTYRAFGLHVENPLTIILLQALISVAVDMLPLPGGMGASENLFLEIFLPVFGADLLLPGMIISRGIGFYSQLIICTIMTFVATFILRKRD